MVEQERSLGETRDVVECSSPYFLSALPLPKCFTPEQSATGLLKLFHEIVGIHLFPFTLQVIFSNQILFSR